MLEDGREADPLAAEDGRHLRQHARLVADGQPQVVPAGQVGHGQHRGPLQRVGEDVHLPGRQGGRAQGDVDQVGDDGAGRRPAAGPAAVEQGVADGVPVHADGVEPAAHVGQHVAGVDQRRVDPQRQPVAGRPLADRQQLDDVPQLAGQADVERVERVDPLGPHVRLQHPPVERQPGQHGQLLGRVPAADVHGRVGLGEPDPLGLGQRPGVRPAVLRHLRQDEVARAVDDADQGVDPVGDQAVDQGRDDRDAAAAAGLEGDRDALPAGQGEQLRPAGGQQRFCWPSRPACRPAGRPSTCSAATPVPPISSTTTSTAGSAMAAAASVVTGSPGRRSALAASRTTTWRRSNVTPVRRRSRSRSSVSRSTTPPPTTPQPSRATPTVRPAGGGASGIVGRRLPGDGRRGYTPGVGPSSPRGNDRITAGQPMPIVARRSGPSRGTANAPRR